MVGNVLKSRLDIAPTKVSSSALMAERTTWTDCLQHLGEQNGFRRLAFVYLLKGLGRPFKGEAFREGPVTKAAVLLGMSRDFCL